MYLLDSNVYIRAFRDKSFGRELLQFHRTELPRLAMSAVVLSELFVGATSPTAIHALRRAFVEPFVARRRLLAPGWPAWDRAGRVDRKLRSDGSMRTKLRQRSFFLDILLASSARELGATIVTLNTADFTLIAEHIDIRFVEPWPAMKEA